MSVTVAKNAGFCFGVSRAVELVEQAAASGKQVVTLGPIIHNRHVVEKFEKLGVNVIATAADATEDMTVIIRSHGVTRRVIQELESRQTVFTRCEECSLHPKTVGGYHAKHCCHPIENGSFCSYGVRKEK